MFSCGFRMRATDNDVFRRRKQSGNLIRFIFNIQRLFTCYKTKNILLIGLIDNPFLIDRRKNDDFVQIHFTNVSHTNAKKRQQKGLRPC